MKAPRSNVISSGQQRPDPLYLMLAAADMDAMGRLFEPEGTGQDLKPSTKTKLEGKQ